MDNKVQTSWSLKEIYESIDADSFKKDYDEYKNAIQEITQFCETAFKNNNKKENLENYFNFKNKLLSFSKLHIYLHLSLSTDTTNETFAKILDQLEDLDTTLIKQEILIRNYISSIPDSELNKALSESDILSEHEFVINELKKDAKMTLSLEEESMIATMKRTGSDLWQKLWEQLTSTLKSEIEIDGEVKSLPLSVIRNYAHSSDENLRKKAYESELASYEKIDKSCSFALNGIKGEVISICKLRGYSSPLEMTLENSRMDSIVLNSMFDSIKEFIPNFREYFKKKAQILNRSEGLRFYDLFAPVGEVELTFTYEEAKEFIINNFSDFSEKLGNFAKNAFENNWIDVYPKEGKMGGAFCEGIHPIKQSRILTNFSGNLTDVTTLAHELGHAYHDSCLYDECELNSIYPMPIAETASTLCETIVLKAALKNASEQEKLVILENDLSETAQVIVDIYSRFLFEDEVFKRRENGPLSVNELNEIMLDAQRKTYGDGLDQEFLHKNMWICKPHYYDANSNYYNFPYAFGLLFSKGLYAKFLNDGVKFVNQYDNLLNATGKNNLKDVGKMVGIDISSKEFWKSSLEIIKSEIDEFICSK